MHLLDLSLTIAGFQIVQTSSHWADGGQCSVSLPESTVHCTQW